MSLEGTTPRRAANRRRLRRARAERALAAVGQVKSEINVTPFVDVVLVLLIIFMVVTPLLQRGVDVLLPLSANHDEKQDTGDQIIVSVRRDQRIFLGRDPMSARQLEHRLRRLLARKPPRGVFVKGDRRLSFAPMRRVIEICQRAGAPGVSLAIAGKIGGDS